MHLVTSLGDMRSTLPLLLTALLAGSAQAQSANSSLLPLPASVVYGKGMFTLTPKSTIQVGAPALKDEAMFLRDALHALNGIQCTVLPGRSEAKEAIQLALLPKDSMPPEGYRLVVSAHSIAISGADEAGVFHGIGSLLQMLQFGAQSSTSLACMTIIDHPRFPWRGMHLDVCRHFFPVEFVKLYIDLLARYKMNTFHWHLTDDQGWRIEVKRYPKLTEVGAWRSGSEYGPYSDRTFDSTRYGGFYNQEEIREVVAYASARHITIVPEIEMPGHSMAALAAYPWLGCTGGPYEVQKGWGVFDDVFCTKDSVLDFIQNVLTEVMELFPGPYIHVGGDECPHVRWKTCPRCQAVIEREGLKDEGELQSYFIRRVEKFINGKGRKLIGWDEILEGGLAPNATVMSWRGTEGGITAAKAGHDVVMTPGTHCYFDHYQGDPALEPLAIGGFTKLQKVYDFEPVPADLDSVQAEHILGAQGNLWTEYITSPAHAEYMALPRMIALAEVLWSPRASRDEAGFIHRLETEFTNLEKMHVDFSRSLYNVGYKLGGSKKRGQVNVDLSAPGIAGEIRYTLDGTMPTDTAPQFASTIQQRGDATIKAALFRGTKRMGNVTTLALHFDKATGRQITLDPAPSERYDGYGPITLVDGVSAGPRRVNNEWLGWTSSRITVTVDLGLEQPLTHTGIGALEERYSWIHPPKEVRIATSLDGVLFTDLATATTTGEVKGRVEYGVDKPTTARYVRFTVIGHGTIEEGFAGAGHAPWTFLDEIHIR